ncbi:MAG: 3-deoxy-D-manno-octulosonate 8-phosphate phosphatase [Crocinitomicaceae bacterium]|nr:3-deoxy-D-manno-octulosonate 8-phosphate phosphatase [Crocinitomicaceae bacterium]
MNLERNIKAICEENGIEFISFLSEMGVDRAIDLTVRDLDAIARKYNLDLSELIFRNSLITQSLLKKIKKIKLVVLDVDGVMTDGGMYFSESGDQFKKFNTKDGMGILELIKKGMQVAIISSGFKSDLVHKRSEMLGIQYCSVNRSPKLERLLSICEDLKINFENVAMIGDDINDLEIIRNVGFSSCPKDAVNSVKREVDIVLETKGGYGCIRELIDTYILPFSF